MSRTARTHRPPSPTMDSKPTNLIRNENIQSTATRGTLKRKSGRNTVHFTADSGNIELIMRTMHWGNQVSVYGAVSSWFTDLSERMQGQKSTGVNKTFISEENEQLSQQLDPQEVASLAEKLTQDARSRGKLLARALTKVRNDDSRRATSHCMRRRRIDQNSLQMNVLQNWRGRE